MQIDGTVRILKLLNENGFSEYAIPTKQVDTFEDVKIWMQSHDKGLVKPSNGKQGLFVTTITHGKNGSLLINYQDHTFEEFTEDVCKKYFEDINGFRDSVPYLQPFLNFTYSEGRALDFRLMRHIGLTGEWEEIATFARVGANSITSNLHSGGFVAKAKDIISEIAGDKAQTIFDTIMMLGYEVPPVIRKCEGENVICIGFDIGIDRDTMHPYIIEANGTPGMNYFVYQFADKRVQYYKHILSRGLNNKPN